MIKAIFLIGCPNGSVGKGMYHVAVTSWGSNLALDLCHMSSCPLSVSTFPLYLDCIYQIKEKKIMHKSNILDVCTFCIALSNNPATSIHHSVRHLLLTGRVMHFPVQIFIEGLQIQNASFSYHFLKMTMTSAWHRTACFFPLFWPSCWSAYITAMLSNESQVLSHCKNLFSHL